MKFLPWFTYFLLGLCSLIFLADVVERETIAVKYSENALDYIPSQVTKTLMFDFPKAYEVTEQIALNEDWRFNQDLSSAEKAEIAKIPHWEGFCGLFSWCDANIVSKGAPLFEKIQQGQIWRLFTPILLHGSLLHILFNMLWLVLLSKQMERRLGWFKLSLFILLVAVFSNILQYMMTGPRFVGFSGVIVGMAAYIWQREKIAPWEGYLLSKATIVFLFAFVLGMVVLQCLAFLIGLFWKGLPELAIANTGHISGAVVGIVLSRIKFFTVKV